MTLGIPDTEHPAAAPVPLLLSISVYFLYGGVIKKVRGVLFRTTRVSDCHLSVE